MGAFRDACGFAETGLTWRGGLPSGEGDPRAMQHVLPLMAQFVDDRGIKKTVGIGPTKKHTHREEAGRVMDREKGTNER